MAPHITQNKPLEQFAITKTPIRLTGKKIVKIQTDVPMRLVHCPDGTVALRPISTEPTEKDSQTIRTNAQNVQSFNANLPTKTTTTPTNMITNATATVNSMTAHGSAAGGVVRKTFIPQQPPKETPNKLKYTTMAFGGIATSQKANAGASFPYGLVPSSSVALNIGYLGNQEMVTPFGVRRLNNNEACADRKVFAPNISVGNASAFKATVKNADHVSVGPTPKRLCITDEESPDVKELHPNVAMAIRAGANAQFLANSNVRYLPYNNKVVPPIQTVNLNNDSKVALKAHNSGNPIDLAVWATNLNPLRVNDVSGPKPITDNANVAATLNAKQKPPVPPKTAKPRKTPKTPKAPKIPKTPVKKELKKRGRKPKVQTASGDQAPIAKEQKEAKPKRTYTKKPKVQFPYVTDPTYDDTFPAEIDDILFGNSPIPDFIYEKYFSMKFDTDACGDAAGHGNGNSVAKGQANGSACSNATDQGDASGERNADGSANGSANGNSESNRNADGSANSGPNGSGNPNGNPADQGESKKINIKQLAKELKEVISIKFRNPVEKSQVKPKGIYAIVNPKFAKPKAKTEMLYERSCIKRVALLAKIRTMRKQSKAKHALPLDRAELKKSKQQYAALQRQIVKQIKSMVMPRKRLRKIKKSDTLYAQFYSADTNKQCIRKIKKHQQLVFYFDGQQTSQSNDDPPHTEVQALYVQDGKDGVTGKPRLLRVQHLFNSDGCTKLRTVRKLHMLPGKLPEFPFDMVNQQREMLQRNMARLREEYRQEKRLAIKYLLSYRQANIAGSYLAEMRRASHDSAKKFCKKIKILYKILYDKEQNFEMLARRAKHSSEPIPLTITLNVKGLCQVLMVHLSQGPLNVTLSRTIQLLRMPIVEHSIKMLLDGMLPTCVPSNAGARETLVADTFKSIMNALADHQRNQAINNLTHNFIHKNIDPDKFATHFELLTKRSLPLNYRMLVRMHAKLVKYLMALKLNNPQQLAVSHRLGEQQQLDIEHHHGEGEIPVAEQLENLLKLKENVGPMIKQACERAVRRIVRELCATSRIPIDQPYRGQYVPATPKCFLKNKYAIDQESAESEPSAATAEVKPGEPKVNDSTAENTVAGPKMTKICMAHLLKVLYGDKENHANNPSLLYKSKTSCAKLNAPLDLGEQLEPSTEVEGNGGYKRPKPVVNSKKSKRAKKSE